ncbi:hypothetical protein [Leifsonia sp. NPDC080035]|uniref:Uncharacterized protein n=1 Tax=Leifsonia sp. NPDC080035 TaxID=3143936 RepID=A0AAU7GF91_9MICO
MTENDATATDAGLRRYLQTRPFATLRMLYCDSGLDAATVADGVRKLLASDELQDLGSHFVFRPAAG